MTKLNLIKNNELSKWSDILKDIFYNKDYKYFFPFTDRCCASFDGSSEFTDVHNFEIITDTNEVIGLINLNVQRNSNDHTFSIFLYSSHFKQGHGTNAINELIKFCKSINLTRLGLDTHNPELVDYYKKLGFTLIGKKTGVCYNPYRELLNEYIFEMIL